MDNDNIATKTNIVIAKSSTYKYYFILLASVSIIIYNKYDAKLLLNNVKDFNKDNNDSFLSNKFFNKLLPLLTNFENCYVTTKLLN